MIKKHKYICQKRRHPKSASTSSATAQKPAFSKGKPWRSPVSAKQAHP